MIVSVGTSSPEAGIDCDQSRFTITGGTIIGIGGDTVPQQPAYSQPVLWSQQSVHPQAEAPEAADKKIYQIK